MKNIEHLKWLYVIVGVVFLVSFYSCKKYLEEKPQSNLILPETVNDLQLILDDNYINNQAISSLTEVLSDNYYVLPATLSAADAELIAFYKWQSIDAKVYNFWEISYKYVLKANVVLDNLDKMKKKNLQEWNNVKGQALFLRSFLFYHNAQLYCAPYSSISNPGIVVRLSSDFNDKVKRATVAETYERIIEDLKIASSLLPVVPGYKTRASKPAAYGALAKTYLSMKMYDSAGVYADRCLKLYDSLMNFNTLTASSAAPIKRFNKEVIYHMESGQITRLLSPSRAKMDSVLMNLYATNDLRKAVYFTRNTDGSYRFKGDYSGSGTSSGYAFGGIVTDEMYLIRAESSARAGNITEAMKDLNTLLQTRWSNAVPYNPIIITSKIEAVKKVLEERRKELLFRGTRWTDLRRLKDEADYSVTPTRKIGAEVFELKPNSPRYTLRIPQTEIDLAGIEQNP
ncbi:tetratricopeptide (TPR) repeat protein [Pedobacter africanus]|uniref:Tetratricopeptide (TPR) repeat protein n=1 Tax=Pedobacter africanus TaxID=151894 RepID=A0ACC6KU96_9SPHI|nr:RagB/SusD family nutrient uptake outer membrane protein [Pedobacter africanus]MDR6782708.1 tetratricopeptide (TPR) repeat protein [Pedobacter africanus]